MSASGQEACALCGQGFDEEISVAGAASICSRCLLSGRFLQSPASPTLVEVAEQLPDLSSVARSLLAPAVREAEEFVRAQDFDAARSSFLEQSRLFSESGQPLLAACMLFRSLRIPGQSAKVYQALGTVAHLLGCNKDAAQFWKTASWLAIKVGDRSLTESVLESLSGLLPKDPWLTKARERLTERLAEKEARCCFCGRAAEEAGPLIAGSQAAVCSGCVRRLMSLDENRH